MDAKPHEKTCVAIVLRFLHRLQSASPPTDLTISTSGSIAVRSFFAGMFLFPPSIARLFTDSSTGRRARASRRTAALLLPDSGGGMGQGESLHDETRWLLVPSDRNALFQSI